MNELIDKMGYIYIYIYIYIYNWILLSYYERKNFYRINKSWKYLTISHKRTNIVWFHLFEVTRVVIFIETESRIMVGKGLEEGKIGS